METLVTELLRDLRRKDEAIAKKDEEVRDARQQRDEAMKRAGKCVAERDRALAARDEALSALSEAEAAHNRERKHNEDLQAAKDGTLAAKDAQLADKDALLVDKERAVQLAISDRDKFRDMAAAAAFGVTGEVEITSSSYKTVAEKHRCHIMHRDAAADRADAPADVLAAANTALQAKFTAPPAEYSHEKHVVDNFQSTLKGLVEAFPRSDGGGPMFAWHDTQKKSFLGDLRPDFTITNANVSKQCLRSQHVRVLVEFKLEDMLEDEVIGQVYVYAQHVFRAQGARTNLVILAADKNGMVRFDATPGSGGDVSLVCCRGVVAWPEAAGVVWRTLEDELRHGAPLNFGEYDVDFCLGKGASSHVFQCCPKELASLPLDDKRRREAAVVVKRAKEASDARDIRHEVCVLTTEVQSLITAETASVPAVVASFVAGTALPWFAMQPVGQHFDVHRFPFRRCHLRQLVTVLQQLHAGGFVHRDIRSRNVVFAQETPDRVVLLDWAFVRRFRSDASPAAVEQPYLGTLSVASDAVLAASSAGPGFTFASAPADDLHSVVRMVYLLLHPAAHAQLAALPQFDRQLAPSADPVEHFAAVSSNFLSFWRVQLSSCEVWRAASAAASSLQYSLLIDLLPVLP